MRQIFLAAVVVGFLLPVCKQSNNTKTINSTRPDSVQVKITYLGTAGWEITDGKTVILIDPYLSRIRRNFSENSIDSTFRGDTRIPVGPDDFVIPDTVAINKYITTADYILVHHSHRDHIMDVPYIALKTGANVIGTESTANFMEAYGVAEEKIITVKGGEDYDFGTFSLKVMPSLHSPLFEKRHYDSHIFPKNKKPPLRITDFVEGNSRLMRVLNYPPIVLPTHWDDFTLPFTSSQEEKLKELDLFRKEITRVSPKTTFIIPKYFEPIIIPGKKQ